MADLSQPSCSIAGVFPYVSELPRLGAQVSVEGYAPRAETITCDPPPKPGAVAFRAFVLGHLGGTDLGICRACGAGRSEHYEGRAWDWGVRADRPEDVERVEKLFSWLFAPGPHGEPNANFRRVGLRYLIWDRKIWSGGTQIWRPYSGSAHRDHVHFTIGWDGALAKTSFYDWLRNPTTLPVELSQQPAWQLAAVMAGGGALGWALAAAIGPNSDRRAG